MSEPSALEWLETDGLGGFAMGTRDGLRTRRYHGLLIAATTPPTGRMALVQGGDCFVQLGEERLALSTQRYLPDVVYPDGRERIRHFATEPWPRWIFDLGGGVFVEQEFFLVHRMNAGVLRWRLVENAAAAFATDDRGLSPGLAGTETARAPITLSFRPFLTARDYHSIQRENSEYRFEAESRGVLRLFRPYEGAPVIGLASNGSYRDEPFWYHDFLYLEERERGLDCVEDGATPGVFEFDLATGPAWLLLGVEETLIDLASEHHDRGAEFSGRGRCASLCTTLRAEERRRRRGLGDAKRRAAASYLVARGRGRSLISGYPWFTDWGRDTFVALRGLCFSLGRLDEARSILLEWSGQVSEGMLPNRFPDRGDQPEYNSVDSSLWFVVCAGELVQAMQQAGRALGARDQAVLTRAVREILDGYARGTRFGIRLEPDGLLAAGEPGVQLTWMDAKVDDWVVTPRIGKPVEVQALWLNALRIGCDLLSIAPDADTPAAQATRERWREYYATGLQAFHRRFWFEERGHLFDVVDADHEQGHNDPSLRPNQIFAVGGLPIALLEGERARAVVEAVESNLWTPLGLRTLAPRDPGYRGRYLGGVRERDSAYHQGTAWAWLLCPFVDAWVRVWGNTREARAEARHRFLEPLHRHLDEAGLGHVSEIADGDAPHEPRGCPFQAWSLGEMLRMERLLADPS